MKARYVLLFLFVLLLGLGCLSNQIRQASHDYINEMQNKHGLYQGLDLKSYLMNRKNASCYMFYCRTNPGRGNWFTRFFRHLWYEKLYNIALDPSLVAGKCGFISFNNSTQFLEILKEEQKDSNFYLSGFGLGVSGSLEDYNAANPYCNSSLKFAVQKIKGNGERYVIAGNPEVSAACLLSKSVIPIYVFDNGGFVPPHPNAYELANKLGHQESNGKQSIGPLILVTEHRPKLTQDNINKIVHQATTLKTFCPTCLVALSVKLKYLYNFSNYNGSHPNSLLNRLKTDPLFNQTIDLIAFGVDSRDLPESQKARDVNAITSLVISAAYYSSMMFNKPSIIYYTYLDPQNYTPKDYADLYYNIISLAPSLSTQGVIGFVASPFYPYETETNCENCSFVKIKNNQIIKNEPAFSVFFSMCRDFYKVYEKNNKRYRKIIPVYYTDSPNSYCSLYFPPPPRISYFGGGASGDVVSLAKEFDINLSDKDELFRCESCFIYDTYDHFPDALKDLSSSYDQNYCNNDLVNQINTFAGIFSTDKVMLQAIAYVKSGLNECYIGNWKRRGKVYWASKDEIRNIPSLTLLNKIASDPNGRCGFNLQPRCANNFDSCGSCNSQSKEYCLPSEFGIFGYSLPLTGNDGLNSSILSDEEKKCGSSYNPFDIQDTSCVVSNKLTTLIDEAYKEIEGSGSVGYYVDKYVNSKGWDDDKKESMKELYKDLSLVLITFAYYNNEDIEPYIEAYKEIEGSVDSGIECSSGDNNIDKLCCDENKDYTDKYGVCSDKMDFVSFVIKTRNSGLGDISDTIKMMAVYKDIYKNCGGCFNKQWINNLCRKLRYYMDSGNSNLPKECR